MCICEHKYVSINVHTYIYFPFVCSESLVAMSTHNIWMLVLNPTPHYKESRLLEDMVDFRTGAGKVQEKPGTSFCAISKSQEPIWRRSPWPNL